MKPMRIVSWIVTLLFFLMFLVNLISLINHSRRGVSPAYVFGMLVGSAVVPSIFWLVAYLFEKNSSANNNRQNPKGKGFNNVTFPDNAPTIPGNTIRTGSYNGGHNAVSGVNPSQTSSFNTAQGNGTPRPSQPNSSQSGSYKSGDLYK
jgi:hypothetical protein